MRERERGGKGGEREKEIYRGGRGERGFTLCGFKKRSHTLQNGLKGGILLCSSFCQPRYQSRMASLSLLLLSDSSTGSLPCLIMLR